MGRIKEDSSDEEDDVPLSQRVAAPKLEQGKPPAVPAAPATNGKPAAAPAADDSEDEDDVPLTKRKAALDAAASKPAPATKKQKVEPKAATNGKPKPSPAAKAKAKPKPADDSDSDVEPAAKKRKEGASIKREVEGPSTSYGERWYEEVDGSEWKRGGVKWKTLEHGGVIFPPLYEPHGKKLIYDGQHIQLNAAQEEVCCYLPSIVVVDSK
eukprot:scaffold234439_cov29-Tisochrysis_lutea.AAC.6